MFFILSTGRSGTHFFARLLSNAPGCICLHEPAPELILEASGYRYGIVSQSDLEKILRDTRSPLINGSVYCESNQTLSLIIPVLAETFPEARYIWLIRNGLDFVASAYQKQWYTGHSENHDRYEDCPSLEKMWIDGRIQGDRCGEMSKEEWQRLDRFGRCCWYWNYVNNTIERDLKKYCPDLFFNLRLEDLEEKLPELLQWMGMDSRKAYSINRSNISKMVPYHWTDWPNEYRKIFEVWCGDLMDRFYADWRIYTSEKAKMFMVPAMQGLKQKVKNLSDELGKHREKVRDQGKILKNLRTEIDRYRSELQETNDRVEQLVAERDSLKSELRTVRKSLSWKITKPLRAMMDLLKKILVH